MCSAASGGSIYIRKCVVLETSLITRRDKGIPLVSVCRLGVFWLGNFKHARSAWLKFNAKFAKVQNDQLHLK